MGVIDGLEGFNDRKLFHGFAHVLALAHAGGVDQGVFLAVALVVDVNTVAGGARLIEHHHPLLAQQAIDEGGFAHIGPAHHGHADTVRVFQPLRLGLLVGKRGQHALDHCAHTAAMAGRHAVQGLNTQGVEIAGGYLLIQSINLVDHQVKGLVALAQVTGQCLVAGIEALAGVDDHQHRIRFLDGGEGLARHLRIDAVLVAADTTGVDHHEAPAAHARLTVLAVAGQPGKIGDQRIPAAGKLVEQGGFADIGAPDQGDNGNHQSFGLIS